MFVSDTLCSLHSLVLLLLLLVLVLLLIEHCERSVKLSRTCNAIYLCCFLSLMIIAFCIFLACGDFIMLCGHWPVAHTGFNHWSSILIIFTDLHLNYVTFKKIYSTFWWDLFWYQCTNFWLDSAMYILLTDEPTGSEFCSTIFAWQLCTSMCWLFFYADIYMLSSLRKMLVVHSFSHTDTFFGWIWLPLDVSSICYYCNCRHLVCLSTQLVKLQGRVQYCEWKF